jgi:hypothetical protein
MLYFVSQQRLLHARASVRTVVTLIAVVIVLCACILTRCSELCLLSLRL